MAQEKRFCTNCGTSLATGDKFCGSCGRQVSGTNTDTVSASGAPAPAPAPVTAEAPSPSITTSGEQAAGVIPASRKKGLLGMESFNIVVTERRLIFAVMTNEMVKESAKEKGQGGFLAGLAGAMTVGYTYYQRYLNMPPEAALKENQQNFSIDLSRVKKIKLEPGKHQRDKSRGLEVYENSRLEIETTGEKYSFNVPHNFHEMAQDVIRKSGLL
jgi:hypothetical protein